MMTPIPASCRSYVAWCAILATALSLSCTDAIGPASSADTVLPAPAFMVAVPGTGTSTTGVPVHALPDRLGASIFTSAMSAINENNWVAGTARTPGDRAVLWRGGDAFVELPTISSRPMRGLGLNESGMVVGEWIGSSGGSLAFRWQDGEGTRLLREPPGFFIGGRAEARDVDDEGRIAVYYWRSSTCGVGPNVLDATAVMSPPWSSSSDYTRLLGPDCENDLSGTTIDGGTVMGRLSTRLSPNTTAGAFRWAAGTTELVGDWNPAALAGAFAAGTRFNGANTVAVRWSGGTPQDLGTLGGAASTGRGVNNLGWVVGHAQTTTGEFHAFVWTPESGMVDLGTLGGAFSTAADINDQGHIVGDAELDTGRRVPVIWIFDPGASDNLPPDIEPIISPIVRAGEELLIAPVVTDPEDDPFTLSWSGDVPPGAAVNGIFSWTPQAGDVGDYVITVTATQDDDPTLSDSETFVVSVLPAPAAELRVTVAPVAAQRHAVGDRVAYIANIVNDGPDAVPVDLTIELPFIHAGAEWGDVPPAAAVNGIFFLELGELAAGSGVAVPFEVVYDAMGVHGVTARIASGAVESALDDNVASIPQVIDIMPGTPGVQAGGLDVPGAYVADGTALAVAGVRVPGSLIAGHPAWDLFLPSDLTPAALLPGERLVTGTFVPGDHFSPRASYFAGDLVPDGVATDGGQWISAARIDGRIRVPLLNEWDPAGRLLFERGATNVRVAGRGGSVLTLDRGVGPGLHVGAAGDGSDADLAFCTGRYGARVGAGDAAELTCGSLTATVLAGDVSIVLADGTEVSAAAGATVLITERDGGYEIAAQDGPVTVVAGGGTTVLGAGESLFVPPAVIEGCKVGFWSQRADLARFASGWQPTGYAPDAGFETVFGVAIGDPALTLAGALMARGGGVNPLLRQAVAALLNASHPDIVFGLDAATVIAIVRDAIASGDVTSAKGLLERHNEAGCPIDGK